MRTYLIAALATVPLLFVLWFMLAVASAFFRVLRGGLAEAREFGRAGFDLDAFAHAAVRRQDSSSSVPTRAGIRRRMVDGRPTVTETRALAKDVI